jgi:hypothetical protein
MRRAAIFHGTDAKPADHWIPWLKSQLEAADYEVFAPELPNNLTPDRFVYEKFLRDSGWDFTDNILVGHSSGATTILNLLTTDWFPKIKAAALVGTFLNERLTKDTKWYRSGQFDNLFQSYDPAVIKLKVGKFYFVHGSNDPYCSIEDARGLCDQLGGEFIVVEGGHHLGHASGLTELPELTEALQKEGLL